MNSADLGKQGILDISVFEEGKSRLHSPDAKGVSIHASTLWDLAAEQQCQFPKQRSRLLHCHQKAARSLALRH